MPQKIIFIASYPESLLNFRLHLIKEFLALNFSVVILAPHDSAVSQKLSDLGVKYISVPLERNGNNPIADLLLLGKLFFYIRQEKPQAVFSYTIKPVIYGTLAAKIAQVPYIFSMLTGTGYVFATTNLKNKVIGFIAKKLFKFSLRFNKKLFFQNKDNLAFFKEQGLVKSEQPCAVVNGSGVDVNFFSPQPLPATISFLMIARLLKDKGVREYVEAARQIKKKYSNVVFKLVGWIDSNPNSITEKELSTWINEGSIEYLGKLADVREVIARSSVYVLPSYGEGTPRTVLEAMAMQRPIITTDVPGCRETIKPHENGFLVEVCNVAALYGAMEFFIQHPQEIEKMGKVSRSIALDKYDVYKVNASIINEMAIENPALSI